MAVDYDGYVKRSEQLLQQKMNSDLDQLKQNNDASKAAGELKHVQTISDITAGAAKQGSENASKQL